MERLSNLALQALSIEQDIPYRFKNPKTKIEDFELVTFMQQWADTSGAFELSWGDSLGGLTAPNNWAGCAITYQRTWVFVPSNKDEYCIVYFDGRFGYRVPYSPLVEEDIQIQEMAAVASSARYIPDENGGSNG